MFQWSLNLYLSLREARPGVIKQNKRGTFHSHIYRPFTLQVTLKLIIINHKCSQIKQTYLTILLNSAFMRTILNLWQVLIIVKVSKKINVCSYVNQYMPFYLNPIQNIWFIWLLQVRYLAQHTNSYTIYQRQCLHSIIFPALLVSWLTKNIRCIQLLVINTKYGVFSCILNWEITREFSVEKRFFSKYFPW